MVGVPGWPVPAPVMLKLHAADQALCTNAPLTDCTRQKYVPLGSPLTVSCVMPTLVELCCAIVAKLEELLTCQL